MAFPLLSDGTFSPHPSRRLGLALALSVLAHLGVLSAFTPAGAPRPPSHAFGALLPPLAATLVRHTPVLKTDATATPPPPPADSMTPQRPALADTQEGTTAVSPTQDTHAISESPPTQGPASSRLIPSRFIPVAELTRPPELISYVNERLWPRMPGIPPGSFRLELSIGANGHVQKVQPDCEGALCEAARIYADIVGQWLFLPGEVLGTQVPSLLILEFEVKGDSHFPDIDQHPPRQ